MTTQELRKTFNDTFGLTDWPEKYEVDHETYANVCQELFSWKAERVFANNIEEGIKWIEVSLGPNNGVIFKNVELILKSKEKENAKV